MRVWTKFSVTGNRGTPSIACGTRSITVTTCLTYQVNVAVLTGAQRNCKLEKEFGVASITKMEDSRPESFTRKGFSLDVFGKSYQCFFDNPV